MQNTHSNRILSVDILRGIIMIIMALDHVRDYFHIHALTGNPLDPASTSIPLFFTRWITHFCAPLFVFLSGISAFLSSRRKTAAEASIFFLKRGIWLIVFELVIMTFGITFNPLYNVLILQVIWVIGWSLVLLAVFSRLSHRLVLVIGLLLFFGHNILDYIPLPQTGFAGALWKIFFTAFGTVLPLGGNRVILDLYAILPWTGVLFCGFALGRIFQKSYSPEKRQQLLWKLGLGLTLLFLVLRLINGYGEPAHWKTYPAAYQTILSFLNTSKYPPSLAYLCMTIGPGLLALSFLENNRSALSRFVMVYGKVPFFYYVLHFYLIHLLCVIFFFATGHTTDQIVDPNVPFLFRPLNFGYGLSVVYIIWITLVLSLYFPCKWFGNYKKNHSGWWLSYV